MAPRAIQWDTIHSKSWHSIEAPNPPIVVAALLQMRRQRRRILRQNLHQGVHPNLPRGLQLFSQCRVQLSAHTP